MSSTCPYPWSYPFITGASSGFGAEFARQLAPTANAIALTARRADILESLADTLRSAHPGLVVHCLACDLASDSARAELPARCVALGFVPDLLINNADLGDYGTFHQAGWPKLSQILAVIVDP